MATIADDFNRADGPAGDNWVNEVDPDTRLWIAGNRAARHPVGLRGSGAHVTPLATDDVSITFVVAAEDSGASLSVRARASADGFGGVQLAYYADFGWYLENGSWEDAGESASGVPHSVRFEVVGTTARLYIGDVLRITATVAAPDGDRYVSLDLADGDIYLDDFSATDVGEGPDAATGFLNWSVGGHAGLSMSALGLRVNQWVHSVLGAFKWHVATVSPINHSTSVIKPIQWSHMAHDGITFVAAGINVLTISATGDSHGTD